MSLDRLRNIGNRHLDDEDKTIQTIFYVMKEFGYTLDEVKSIPITTFKYMVRFLDEESKELKKEVNRMKAKK